MKNSFVDRKDAKRCLDVSGMNQIMIDLKPRRSLAELYINQEIDVTNLVNYMQKKKDDKLTYFHAFVYIVGKVLYHRPLLNRFVANRHVYEHNDITLSYVMKIAFSAKSEEVMVINKIEDDDTLFTISKKVSDKVNNIRQKKDSGTGANKAIHVLGKLPNIIRIPVISIFTWADRHGLLPNFLIKDNIYYSSMIISNVGTFKCGGIYHNVTDFGTCSGLITMGEIKERKVTVNGKEEKKYYSEFGLTIDERIADGFYFVKSLHLMEYLFSHPECLEDKIKDKIEESSIDEKKER